MKALRGSMAALALAIAASSASAGLTHQWTFNNSLADTGSAASGNATLVNGAVLGASNVTFDGTNDEVDLPAGVGTSIGAATNVAVAAWFTWTGTTNWQAIASLGNDTNNYIALFPKGDNPQPNLDYYLAGAGQTQYASAGLPAGANLLVGVWDVTNNQARIYVNGALVGTDANLAGYHFTGAGGLGVTAVNKLGQDLWGDDHFKGNIDQLEIYTWDAQGSAPDAAALFAAGPVVVPEPASLSLLGLGVLGMLRRRR